MLPMPSDIYTAGLKGLVPRRRMVIPAGKTRETSSPGESFIAYRSFVSGRGKNYIREMANDMRMLLLEIIDALARIIYRFWTNDN